MNIQLSRFQYIFYLDINVILIINYNVLIYFSIYIRAEPFCTFNVRITSAWFTKKKKIYAIIKNKDKIKLRILYNNKT